MLRLQIGTQRRQVFERMIHVLQEAADALGIRNRLGAIGIVEQEDGAVGFGGAGRQRVQPLQQFRVRIVVIVALST
jgi:hypothetical protein